MNKVKKYRQDSDGKKQEKSAPSPGIEDNGDVNMSGSGGDGQEK